MTNGRHLLDLDDAQRPFIEGLIQRAREFKARGVDGRPKGRRSGQARPLHSKLVVGMFFEPSTRTVMSFAAAAQRLGAHWLNFEGRASSLVKGETLEDTMRTVRATGADALVVRHAESGFPHALARHFTGSVINAGDGWHAHPTQGLLDAMTLLEEFGTLEDRRLVIAGDVRHSRVARSSARAAWLLGAKVTLCGPPMLLPLHSPAWGFAELSSDLEACLPGADALMLLRIQKERGDGTELPPAEDLIGGYSLTTARAAMLPPHAIVMHPGPVNRSVEIDGKLVTGKRSRIDRQVENGVYVRMAVLERVLGPAHD